MLQRLYLVPKRLSWTKLGQRDITGHVPESGRYAHADLNLLPGTADNVAGNPDSIGRPVDSHLSDDVWYIARESRVKYPVDHDVGRYASGPAEREPLELPRVAIRAQALGRPAEMFTAVAALGPQLAGSAALPEGSTVLIRCGERSHSRSQLLGPP
jgi:hypothetical protein